MITFYFSLYFHEHVDFSLQVSVSITINPSFKFNKQEPFLKRACIYGEIGSSDEWCIFRPSTVEIIQKAQTGSALGSTKSLIC